MHGFDLEETLFQAKAETRQAALGAISSIFGLFNFKSGIGDYFLNLIGTVIAVNKLCDCFDRVCQLKDQAEAQCTHKPQFLPH